MTKITLEQAVWSRAKPGKQRQSLLGMIGTIGELDVYFWAKKQPGLHVYLGVWHKTGDLSDIELTRNSLKN